MSNDLLHSESLYLQQHAHNPVHWKRWSQEAFDLALQLNKPVLVSIGYAACHWCHVMERESFEDEAVALYMNEHFVCIKVDREEHPAVDHMYMDALIAMNNQGGWPLNMFVTPDKKPFYGGTYFPPQRLYGRPSWMEVLRSMNHYWEEQRSEIVLQANQLYEHLNQINTVVTIPAQSEETIDVEQIVKQLMLQADEVFGGFRQAPKFPSTMALESLLLGSQMIHDDAAFNHVIFTLEKMLHSGIFDQVEGGLSRYSTDNDWKVPHFEKMLYDNALFLSLLSKCYKYAPLESLKAGMKKIIDFVDKNWLDKNGLYYSSMDADSEGEEGRYYVFSWEEINDSLTEFGEYLLAYYQVERDGNWEHGKNILHGIDTVQNFCQKHSLDLESFIGEQQKFLARLERLRNIRIMPNIDKKQQLSWNALWNIALADAAKVLNDDKMFTKAIEHMDKMIEQFWGGGQLFHLKYPNHQIMANADDWSYFINALIKIAEISQQSSYMELADELLNWGEEHFFDIKSEMYAFSDIKDESILVRKIEMFDNAQPSVNAIQVENLEWMGIWKSDSKILAQSENILQKIKGMAIRYPLSYGQSLLNIFLKENREVISWNPEKIRISLRQKWAEKGTHRLFLGFKTTQELLPKYADSSLESYTGKAIACTRIHCRMFDE